MLPSVALCECQQLFNYSLAGQVLDITLTNSASSKLSFLRRTMKGCPEKLKLSMICSIMRTIPTIQLPILEILQINRRRITSLFVNFALYKYLIIIIT